MRSAAAVPEGGAVGGTSFCLSPKAAAFIFWKCIIPKTGIKDSNCVHGLFNFEKNLISTSGGRHSQTPIEFSAEAISIGQFYFFHLESPVVFSTRPLAPPCEADIEFDPDRRSLSGINSEPLVYRFSSLRFA